MEKDYLAEYVIGRIHELEKDLEKTRKDRDGYKRVLTDVRNSAETVFKHLKHQVYTQEKGQESRIYSLSIWDTHEKEAYEYLKTLLWLLGVTDPGELVKENEEKE